MAFDSLSPVIATSADPNFVDVFALGESGGAYWGSWKGGRGWLKNGLLRLGAGQFFKSTPLSANVWAEYDGFGTLLRHQWYVSAIGEDGHVWQIDGEDAVDGGPSGGWRSIGGRTFTQGTTIATVLRDGGEANNNDAFVDLYAVGMDGRVYTAWGRDVNTPDDHHMVYEGWAPIGVGTFSQKTPVAAITLSVDKIDIYAVGEDGRVYTAWHRGSSDWQGWAHIGNGTFAQKTPIAALGRDGDKVDLFAVGMDGKVYTAWIRGGSDWAGWAPVGVGSFPQVTRVTPIARGSDKVDLYAIGMDGLVYTAWIRGGGDWSGWASWGNWAGAFPSAPTLPATSVSAVALDDNIHVYAIAGDGEIYFSQWREDPGHPDSGWGDWARLSLPQIG